MKKGCEMMIHASGVDLGMQWQSQSGSDVVCRCYLVKSAINILILSVHSVRQFIPSHQLRERGNLFSGR